MRAIPFMLPTLLVGAAIAISACNSVGADKNTPTTPSPMPASTGRGPVYAFTVPGTTLASTQAATIAFVETALEPTLMSARDALRKYVENSKDADIKSHLAELDREMHQMNEPPPQ